ncbi:MAG TPA: winged helix-turn-helix domain-containing protein [Ktedonobacterales bacterium]|nr:winged helix-turn-helix domain-containing protein [Ktedonobacterales bacterium]
MGKRLHLEPHLAAAELEQRYRTAHEPHERSWWQILWLLATGHPAAAVAEVTGYSRYWIGQLVKRYNTQGPAGMHNRQHTTSRRAQPMLSAGQQEELRQALAGPTPEGERRWTARAVAAWMSAKLGRPVCVQRGWDYLQRLKHSQQLPRPQHVLADPDEQDAFKKTSVPC